MSDFEVHPIGTAKHIAELEAKTAPACHGCGYRIAWAQHNTLKASISCPRCFRPDQFGPGTNPKVSI